eukprot:TRINITY_DN2017_c0_g1_i2.p1 TRINITY_DN2017_c0_g1~~TRINITY_DN2017_c0_g1_i2.p1  ORF type:complete len:302 (-),score=24.52 TRINITY_DN2017_c0_g1_i2:1266-2171(-)
MLKNQYEIGEPIWVRARGKPWWPAQVLHISVSSDTILVKFIGENTKLLVPSQKTKPYKQNYEEYSVTSRSDLTRAIIFADKAYSDGDFEPVQKIRVEEVYKTDYDNNEYGGKKISSNVLAKKKSSTTCEELKDLEDTIENTQMPSDVIEAVEFASKVERLLAVCLEHVEVIPLVRRIVQDAKQVLCCKKSRRNTASKRAIAEKRRNKRMSKTIKKDKRLSGTPNKIPQVKVEEPCKDTKLALEKIQELFVVLSEVTLPHEICYRNQYQAKHKQRKLTDQSGETNKQQPIWIKSQQPEYQIA